MNKRNQYSGPFKAKVVVAAIQGHKTISELASQYGVHPNQIRQWKQQALDELPQVLSDGRGRAARAEDELKARLYQQIGQLQVELEWLKKKVGLER